MRPGNIFSALSVIGLLALLNSSATATQPVETPEIRSAVQNATTRSDHEVVAKYYEDAARQMQSKVQEKKELLEQYQNKSYLYGRQAQDLQAHTEALVRSYEQSAQVNMQEAALHRQMAAKLEEKENHARSGARRLSAVDGSHQGSAAP